MKITWTVTNKDLWWLPPSELLFLLLQSCIDAAHTTLQLFKHLWVFVCVCVCVCVCVIAWYYNITPVSLHRTHILRALLCLPPAQLGRKNMVSRIRKVPFKEMKTKITCCYPKGKRAPRKGDNQYCERNICCTHCSAHIAMHRFYHVFLIIL